MQTDVRQIQGFFNIMYHVFKFFIHPSICPSIHLSMYSSIYPSIHHIWQCADRCKTHPRVFQYYVTCFYVFFNHPSTHLSMNFTWTASLICLKPESHRIHVHPFISLPSILPFGFSSVHRCETWESLHLSTLWITNAHAARHQRLL